MTVWRLSTHLVLKIQGIQKLVKILPTHQLIVQLQEFSEFWAIFAIYSDKSLKSKTRNNRTNDTQIQYQVDDSIIIKQLKRSDFVFHTQSKPNVTAYLGQKPETATANAKIPYVISCKSQCLTNVKNFYHGLQRNNHEQTDIVTVLHCFQIEMNPFRKVLIVYSDKNILLMLLCHYQSLCTKTMMREGRGDNKQDVDIRK